MTLVTMTGTIGSGMLMVKTMPIEAEDGMVTEVKEIVAGEEGEDGTLILITNNRGIHNNPTIQTLIIIIHFQWAISINTRCLMNNILLIHNHNSNTRHNDRQCNRVKLQTYANYAKIRAIMIISASSQAILWPIRKKRLTKVVHIIIRIQIKVTGQTGRMIIMTPMANLFSKGGSRCC